MRCKKCGRRDVEIISRDIVFETFAGKFYDILYYCPDCDKRWEERVWVLQ
jgi:uncharacterized protein with PIN domain